MDFVQNGWVLLPWAYWNEDYLSWRNCWWQDQALVVAVSHNHSPNQASGYPEGASVRVNMLVIGIEVTDVESLRKLSPHVVGSPGLNSFTVLHHSFNGEGANCPSKALRRCFLTVYHWHRQDTFHDFLIDLEHTHSTVQGFLAVSVSRMAFLPEELRGPQEWQGLLLPTEHVGPLVDFEW